MFFEVSFITIIVVACIYIFIKMFYYKNLIEQETKNNDFMKATLNDAEIIIRKYQMQLQRSLGNIDILTDELSKIKSEIKVLKQRNTQHRNETEKLRSRLKDMESRINALL